MMKGFVHMADNVYRLAVPFTGCWTGATLVLGCENILVDSGGCADTVDSTIVPALEAMGLSLKDVSWLAITHIHGDHVGGCARLLELAPHLRVACYAGSLARMRDPLTYSKEIRSLFPAFSAAAPAVLKGCEPDLLLGDGDMLGTLRLLHTPGHDTDACSYYDERTQTLITGDSLQLNGTASQGCALLMDVTGYEATLAQLLELPIRQIVCGHPYLPLGAEAIGTAECRRYLQACLACTKHDEGFVNGMLAAGADDIALIARALIREVGGKEPAQMFLPMRTVSEYIRKRRNHS
ncbi:MAG: MBL fold metallo-hydrolase [Clostridia bacterium]